MKKLSLVMSLLVVVAVLVAACAPAAPAGALVVQADIVRGSTAPLGPVCSNVSQLAQGEMAVPRAKIFDPAMGQELTDDDLTSVNFILQDGQSFPMSYAGHGGDEEAGIEHTDYFWATGWEVPEDYPLGTIKWWVTAEHKDGRSGRYDPINMVISMLTIIERPTE